MGDVSTAHSYEILTAALKNEFQAGWESAQPMAKELYQEIGSITAENVYPFLNGIPGFRKWEEGTRRIARNIQILSTSVKNDKWEDTIAIPRTAFDDNLANSYRPIAKGLGEQAGIKIDEEIYGLLNNGFDVTTTFDSQYLFSNSHTIGVSTVDNLSSGALADTTFETAYKMLRGFTFKPDNASGARPLNYRWKPMLIVPVALETTAKKIVEAALVTTTGGTNVLATLGCTIHVSPYLDAKSTTAWYLANVGTSMKPFMWQNRQKARLVEKTPFNDSEAWATDEIIYSADMRGAALATFPWLVVGSPGTES